MKEIFQRSAGFQYMTQDDLAQGDDVIVMFFDFPLVGYIHDIIQCPDGSHEVTIMFQLGTMETFSVSSLN